MLFQGKYVMIELNYYIHRIYLFVNNLWMLNSKRWIVDLLLSLLIEMLTETLESAIPDDCYCIRINAVPAITSFPSLHTDRIWNWLETIARHFISCHIFRLLAIDIWMMNISLSNEKMMIYFKLRNLKQFYLQRFNFQFKPNFYINLIRW